MIYAIFSYGQPVLRQKAAAIEQGTDVRQLAEGMLATMEQAQGVGLAAPQVGHSVRMFVINLSRYKDEGGGYNAADSKVFINPTLTIDTAVAPNFRQEGCLSFPNILVDVLRYEKVMVRYFDVNWQLQEEVWTGFSARVIQHEYDHLEGKLHIDYASPLRKRLLKSKLKAISDGKVEADYKMRFPS